jgi:hypothetical protein
MEFTKEVRIKIDSDYYEFLIKADSEKMLEKSVDEMLTLSHLNLISKSCFVGNAINMLVLSKDQLSKIDLVEKEYALQALTNYYLSKKTANKILNENPKIYR